MATTERNLRPNYCCNDRMV